MWSATAEVKTAAPASTNRAQMCLGEPQGLCQLPQVAQTSQTLLCHVLTFGAKHHTSTFPVSFY